MPFILDREIDPLYQEGVEKGKAEATKETKIDIAKSLLDLLDDETIAKKTTLSVKEVKKLRATGD
jgi:hypothetical protein